MPFRSEIVGGTKLLIPAIRSPNYIAGVQGWSINKDGTVEFASGTFRGPVVIINPVTQEVLASIGATGNIAGQTLSAANDILLGNLSLADYFTGAPRGLISEIAISGTLPSTGDDVFTDTAWIEFQAVKDRFYWITTTPFEVVNPGGPAGTDQVRSRLDMTSTDGGFNGTVYDVRMDVDEQAEINPSFLFYAFNTATQRVQLKLLGRGVIMTLPNTSDSFKMWVVDLGNNPAVSHIGGKGTATGAQTFTKQYICTASRSYDGNGNPIGSPDQDNNVYAGEFPDRTFGNERSYLIFPMSTIRTDLAGATVNSARAYFYCFKAEETAGSIGLKAESSGTLPATWNPGLDVDCSKADSWPIPGWDSVNIVGDCLNAILAGDNALSMPPVLFGLAATGFRGFGYSVDFRPYIKITYTK